MPPSLIDACQNKNLFQHWFSRTDSWKAWYAFMKATFGEKMDDTELEIFKKCTTRKNAPPLGNRFKEVWLACGRRSGKSQTISLIAVYMALFHDWSPFLSPGERGTVMVIASDRQQARIVFRYIIGFLNIDALKSKIIHQRADSIDLTNNITIEVHTANFRSVRGYTIVAALLDEIAFWRGEESTIPDKELLEAIQPGMLTIPDAMILCASSPYARKGVLWNVYKDYFGKENNDILVWKAPSLVMNPTLPKKVVEEAYERDPAWASSEYGGEFRSDVESFIPYEVLDRFVDYGVFERPLLKDVEYIGFVDPSGGHRDAMVLAIAHYDEKLECVVLDALAERLPPFSPKDVVREFCALLKKYKIYYITGDRYAGEWPREQFRDNEVEYISSEFTKSEIYMKLLPRVNNGQIRLIENKRMFVQMTSLERRTSRNGRDSVDHPVGGFDDLANAAAGAITIAAARMEGFIDLDNVVFGSGLESPNVPSLDSPYGTHLGVTDSYIIPSSFMDRDDEY